MLRKMIKMLLCLMLAVMLPLCAIADVQHTFRILPGAGIAPDQTVTDLLDAVSLTVTKGTKSGALTLNLDDTALATIAVSADATGMYVHSNLLSDDVLYVTWDDGFAYLTRLIGAELTAQGASAADVQAIESTMNEMKNTIVATITASPVSVTPVVSPQESMDAAAEMFKDDPQMAAYVKHIYDKMTIETGSFTAESRDAADGCYTLSMDEKDLIMVLDTSYLRTIVRDIVATGDNTLEGDALEKATDAALAEMRKVYEESQFDLIMTMYTIESGETLVGMEMGMNMTADGEDGSVNMTMNMSYDRLTDENGVSHIADMHMSVDEAEQMQMLFTLHRGVNEVSRGRLAMLAGGEELIVSYEAENTAPDVRRREVNLYLRSGANAIIEPVFSDRPLIGFEAVTSPANHEMLRKIEQADSHNSVNVMKLSDEEMQTFISGVQSRLIQTAYSALAKLPTSALQLAMQMIQ